MFSTILLIQVKDIFQLIIHNSGLYVERKRIRGGRRQMSPLWLRLTTWQTACERNAQAAGRGAGYLHRWMQSVVEKFE